MYMSNSSSGNDSVDAAANDSKKRRLQMELLILDSDTRKLTNEKNSLDVEIRKLRQDGERIRLLLDSKKGRYDVVLREILSKEEEIKQFKKKLNAL
jgi:chromosome segregation ATPase